MAIVTVKLHGEEVLKLTLESGMEYVAGRAADAAIPLKNERGISRHHFKFVERNGLWIAQSLSKFIHLQRAGESVEIVELNENLIFSVPPYEFHFELEAAAVVTEAQAPAPTANPAQPESPSENAYLIPQVNRGVLLNSSEPTGSRVNNEATAAGVSTLVPYFRISYPNTADDEVLKLEGNIWVAGRDADCEIPIDSAHVSRKHFELARSQEGFFVTDLGSSNGTKLNGNRIPPHEPTRLESGDELRVMNVIMLFEIRDSHFNMRVDNLPVPAFDPMFAALPQAHAHAQAPVPWPTGYPDAPTEYRSKQLEEIPEGWERLKPKNLKKMDWRKNKVRVALIVLIPLVLILAVMPDKKKEDSQRGPAKEGSVVFESLTAEQKSVVKDSFNLARNLYVQGKYELCLTELAKVHQMIPQFENSKELQSFCEQGRELVKRQRDLEYKERERAMIEQQITGHVEGCKAKLKKNSTVEDTRQCLAEAIELAPEHHMITAMIHSAQIRDEERQFLAQQKEEQERKTESGKAHFRKVKSIAKSGNLAKAIVEYEKFLDTYYPRIDSEKAVARRDLANLKRELKTKVDAALKECKDLRAKQQFKDGYIACTKALDEDPKSAEAKEHREHMLGELRRIMKNIYEDSVLEESLGNVDSAKEKWKKIIKEDLESGDYAIKAKSKLQKYGGG